MKYKNNRWRIPMINLQLFADGEGDGSGAGDGNEDGAGAGSGDSGNEMSFDDFSGAGRESCRVRTQGPESGKYSGDQGSRKSGRR